MLAGELRAGLENLVDALLTDLLKLAHSAGAAVGGAVGLYLLMLACFGFLSLRSGPVGRRAFKVFALLARNRQRDGSGSG
jgi:hypothetical protein